MRIVFDIGANNGDSTLHMAKEGATVYAFEPVPEMITEIESKTHGLPNYHLTKSAVSNYNGRAKFYVAGQSDWGCSSLNEFSDNLEKTWAGRTDFKVTHEIEVDVIRLDTFVESRGITTIDYLHCDAQGSDLQVLEGLGKYIDIVKEGVIEISANDELALYKGTDNTLLTAVDFLTKNGIRWIEISPWAQEYNIHFKRV
jgi:FkbM family methyltransferase